MKKKILAAVAVILCLFAALAVAVSAESEPTTEIMAHNLALEDNIQIIYYVDFENVPENAEKGVLIWKNPVEDYVYGTETEKLTVSTGTYGDYIKYNYTKVSAKMMSQDIYAKSYIKVGDDITYSPLDKYSVLQYCYNKKGSTSTAGGGTKTLGELVEKMLEYGAWAQEYFNYNTDRMADATYYTVDVINGTLADGMTSGLYPTGAELTLKAEAADGAIVFWENSAGNVVGTAVQLAISAPAKNETYTVSHILEWVEGVSASCTENGIKGYYDCSICGKKFDAEYNEVTDLTIAALGHSWDDGVVTTPATTTATGVMTYTCAVCGAMKAEEIPVEVTLNYSKGLEYTSNGDGTCYVSDIGDCTDTEIVIPEESPDGETVTGIGQEAFSYCSDITSIYIPDSVTSIGNSAFYRCNKLTDITIGNGVENVGNNIFYNCPIENATIPTIVIPYIRKEILKTLVINGGTSIGNSAFEGCSSLTSVTFAENSQLTSIGSSAFSNCVGLISVTFAENSQIMSIEQNAFEGCRALTSIKIPASVTSIGSNAFYNCIGLTTLTFAGKSQLIVIGNNAFYGCSELTSVNITDITEWCKISFDNRFSNPLYYACHLYLNDELVTELIIPVSVKKIRNYTFYNCSSLKSINIPASVTVEGFYTFYNCPIETATLPTSAVSSIGTGNLKTVVITGGTKIESSSFSGATSLTSIKIPTSVKSIGSRAFESCTSLTNIDIPVLVTSIGDYAFVGCSSLTSIKIPSSVTSIGNEVFKGCSSLKNINIPLSVTNIGNSVFSGCPIETATIPTNAISFIPKGKLKTVVITGGTSIGNSAFSNANLLTSVTISTSVKNIGSSAFSGCTKLTSITIPNSVTSIGENAFKNCTLLTSILYQGTKSQWKAINKEAGWDDNLGDYTLYFEN